ncbi:MAG TPA: hypothetical protein VMM15_23800 [Bradyrhizobium sp.]|nr:hypothetical protein [Bradyrhizobium sp.]
MNREQAAEIQGHLLEADGAMARARRAIAGLAKEDREKFDARLAEIAAAPQSEVLAAIMSGTLTWRRASDARGTSGSRPG